MSSQSSHKAIVHPTASTAGGRLPAIYSRYSTVNQSDKSLEDQQREVRSLFGRLGIDDGRVIVIDDAAQSGTKSDREGFQRLLAMAEAGQISVIGVDDQSRLSRADNVVDVIRDLLFRGVRVVSGDGLDTDVEGWQLKCRVLGLHNATTIDESSRRIRRGLKGRVLRNLSIGDYPYGYRSECVDPDRAAHFAGRGPRPERRVIIYEPEAYWVREIFRLFSYERWSHNRIARHLTQQRAPVGNRGKSWSHERVRKMLSNPKYAGTAWRWGATRTIRDSHGRKKALPTDEQEITVQRREELRIVDLKTWDLTQNRLAELQDIFGPKPGQKSRGPRVHHTHAYPSCVLDGVCFCGECGLKMVWDRTGDKLFRKCSDRSGVCKSRPRLPTEEASAKLLQLLSDMLYGMPEWLAEAIAVAREQIGVAMRERGASVDPLRKQLSEAERARGNLLDFVQVGNYDGESVLQRLHETDANIQYLQAQILEAEALASAELTFPDDAWFGRQLQDLVSLLQSDQPQVALVLRKLLGKVSVQRIVPAGKVRGYHQMRFNINCWSMIAELLAREFPESIRRLLPSDPTDARECSIDVGRLSPTEQLGPEVARLREAGTKWRDLAKMTGLPERSARYALKRFRELRKMTDA